VEEPQISVVKQICQTTNIGRCFDDVTRLAARIANMRTSLLAELTPNGIHFFSTYGFSAASSIEVTVGERILSLCRTIFHADDVASHDELGGSPLQFLPDPIGSLYSIPVPFSDADQCIVLVCADTRKDGIRHPHLIARLVECAQIAANEFALIVRIARLQDGSIATSSLGNFQVPLKPAVSNPTILADLPSITDTSRSADRVAERFLLDTLLQKHRLLRRSNQLYYGNRTWAKAIKHHQIAAVRAIKGAISPEIVDAAAEDLAQQARMIGVNLFKYVSPMACGCSGPGCLAEKIAEATAAKLGLEYAVAFDPLPVSGSSHPAKNARLPIFRANRTFDAPVVLIDDIATSGAHIEKAAIALKAVAPAVLPLVWIAD